MTYLHEEILKTSHGLFTASLIATTLVRYNNIETPSGGRDRTYTTNMTPPTGDEIRRWGLHGINLQQVGWTDEDTRRSRLNDAIRAHRQQATGGGQQELDSTATDGQRLEAHNSDIKVLPKKPASANPPKIKTEISNDESKKHKHESERAEGDHSVKINRESPQQQTPDLGRSVVTTNDNLIHNDSEVEMELPTRNDAIELLGQRSAEASSASEGLDAIPEDAVSEGVEEAEFDEEEPDEEELDNEDLASQDRQHQDLEASNDIPDLPEVPAASSRTAGPVLPHVTPTTSTTFKALVVDQKLKGKALHKRASDVVDDRGRLKKSKVAWLIQKDDNGAYIIPENLWKGLSHVKNPAGASTSLYNSRGQPRQRRTLRT